MKVILLAIIIGIIILILSEPKENFIDIYSDIITFRQIDGVLIKNYKINSFYSLYDNELLRLFNNNDIIKINIPLNYSVTIKYSLKNDSSQIAKIIELPNGTYEVYKSTSDKIINQVDIKNMIGYNNNTIVRNNQSMPMYWDSDLYYNYRPEYTYTSRLDEYYSINPIDYNQPVNNKSNCNNKPIDQSTINNK